MVYNQGSIGKGCLGILKKKKEYKPQGVTLVVCTDTKSPILVSYSPESNQTQLCPLPLA